MIKPNVLITGGLGLNCDEETKFAFEEAGAKADIVHINDLIERADTLKNYQMIAFVGGFSYGDDTGSGYALANRIKNNMWEELLEFAENKDKLAIGICNGFQVMVNLGLLPAFNGNYGARKVALEHNENARYDCRWVDLQFEGKSPWTKDIGMISIPIAHGEGKFSAENDVLVTMNIKELVAARYVSGEMCAYQNLEANPNGSLENIASITDESGRLIGMMPHPERGIHFTQLPNWIFLKEMLKQKDWPSKMKIEEKYGKYGPGMKIFENGVAYFR